MWPGEGGERGGGILSVSAPPLLCGKKGGGKEWRKSEGRKKRRRRETAEGFQSINGERKEGLPRGGLHTHKFPLPPRFSVFGRGRAGGRLSIFGRPRREPPYVAFVVKKKKKGKRKDAGKCFVFCTFFAAPSVLWPYLACVSPLLFASVLSGEGHLGENQNLQGSGADDISLSPSKCKGFFYFSEYVMREI